MAYVILLNLSKFPKTIADNQQHEQEQKAHLQHRISIRNPPVVSLHNSVDFVVRMLTSFHQASAIEHRRGGYCGSTLQTAGANWGLSERARSTFKGEIVQEEKERSKEDVNTREHGRSCCYAGTSNTRHLLPHYPWLQHHNSSLRVLVCDF